ncbi:hypothetical protein [Pedobacter immunditicola]|uniref:hypothetical protein n=1 Tax=Pedobacter immunditicola TaxID=3133440 RepID=UPI0030A194E5
MQSYFWFTNSTVFQKLKNHFMAKRRAYQKRRNHRGLQDVLISLGILLSLILFIIKFTWGGIGWIEIFAPVMIVLFISFLLAALKKVFERI